MSAESLLRFTCDLCGAKAEVVDSVFLRTRPAFPEGWFEVRPADPAVMASHCCADCWARKGPPPATYQEAAEAYTRSGT